MKTQLLFSLMLAAALVGMAAPPAAACDGFGYGYGWLYNSLDYHVPYFAAHPPVYYSHPVPRTYGYSPFAYPPSVMTPEIAGPIQPLEISNPYVPSSQREQTPPIDREVRVERQSEPLVVINPFVPASRAVARAGR